jgi:hypothetical protein
MASHYKPAAMRSHVGVNGTETDKKKNPTTEQQYVPAAMGSHMGVRGTKVKEGRL